jgi:hypothetical protein
MPHNIHVEICAHCGRDDVRTHDAGHGRVFGKSVCHPTASGRPDCYRLVTIHYHDMPCTLRECHDGQA